MQIALMRKVVVPATGKKASEIIFVDWNSMKPEGDTPQEQFEWFESTYVWMPAKIHGDGSIHNMRVGQVFRKGPRKGEIGVHKKQQKPVPRHLREQGVQDEGTALGTYEIGWDYKTIPDKPDATGRVYLDSAGSERNSSGGNKGSSLGQRILSYGNWVPIWVVYDTRYYKALRKKFKPRVQLYRPPKPEPELKCDICGQVFKGADSDQTLEMHKQHWIRRHENSHENLSAVARTLDLMRQQKKKSSLTATGMTSTPKALPSLETMIAAIKEEGSVDKKDVKGSTVEQSLVRPAKSLAI